jgi:hypothetical protein
VTPAGPVTAWAIDIPSTDVRVTVAPALAATIPPAAVAREPVVSAMAIAPVPAPELAAVMERLLPEPTELPAYEMAPLVVLAIDTDWTALAPDMATPVTAPIARELPDMADVPTTAAEEVSETEPPVRLCDTVKVPPFDVSETEEDEERGAAVARLVPDTRERAPEPVLMEVAGSRRFPLAVRYRGALVARFTDVRERAPLCEI